MQRGERIGYGRRGAAHRSQERQKGEKLLKRGERAVMGGKIRGPGRAVKKLRAAVSPPPFQKSLFRVIILNRWKQGNREDRRLKILGQRLSDGSVRVFDAPDPVITDGFVRVRTLYSAISTGTEGGKVISGKMSLLGKARSRPAQVMQVAGMVGSLGLKATYLKVRSKLEGAQPLGYSLCGRVIETRGNVDHARVGDLVACAGGGYANHADEVVVPRNLVVKVPDGIDPRAAAYATIASISLQGVRLAEPTLGESAVVIGLGIVGQLAAQILKANGCRVFGTDIDEGQVGLALSTGAADSGGVTGRDSVEAMVSDFTRGRGADMVLICAGTPGNGPVEFAAEVSRKRGRIVSVGAVGMDLPREAYFRKELSFSVSCSYGPGRYDPGYEEAGMDYPYPYVRWTEGRNIEAVLDGMAAGTIDPMKATTHVFPLDKAPEAYGIISGRTEPFCGMLIEYPVTRRDEVRSVPLAAPTLPVRSDRIGIAMAGPGSFAQTFLLPPLKGDKRVFFSSIATRSGLTASDTGRRFGFRRAVGGMDDILNDPETHAVVVATRHDTHAASVLACLRAGKPVFVEKPLCLTVGELREIRDRQRESGTIVQVGFNRRFSKAAAAVRRFIGEDHPPLTMMYRVSAGHIPRDHWTQTAEGGGRIVGEVCHFIDLLHFFCGADPVAVHAESIDTADESVVPGDNTVITIKFRDGSVGSIGYFSEGGRSMPKERCEVFGGGRSAVIDNFSRVNLFDGSVKRTKTVRGKGHSEEMGEFVTALRTGRPAIPIHSLITVTLASFAVLESLKTGMPAAIDTEHFQNDQH